MLKLFMVVVGAEIDRFVLLSVTIVLLQQWQTVESHGGTTIFLRIVDQGTMVLLFLIWWLCKGDK